MPNFLAFVLGKNPELSIAEIVSYLDSRKIGFSIATKEKEFLIIDFHDPARYPEIKIDELGGTLKICPIFIGSAQFSASMVHTEAFFDLSKKSVNFGISLYNVKNWDEIRQYLERYLKAQLRENRIKAGYIKTPGSSAAFTHTDVINKKLLQDAEIAIFYSNGRYYIGKTDSVHNPFEFRKRDLERPEQRAIFSIPPRLAKIMVNLTGINEGIILDPFCGIGTILQEAAINGFEIRGVDLDKSCITSAIKNFGWLKKEYSLELKELDKKIIPGDSRHLSKYFEKESIDGIATEPYLGPPLKARTERQKVEKIIGGLTELYSKVLSECHKVLKPRRRVCIVSPRIKVWDKNFSLNIPEICIKTGFKQVNILSKCKIKSDFPLIDGEDRHRLIREINVLEKI